MSIRFQIGQRWLSETEPELGLGIVQQCTDRTVTIEYPASGESRQYSLETPPLRRVRFHPGDTITPQSGELFVAERVFERGGVLFYGGDGRELSEKELSHRISFNEPAERLRSQQFDPPGAFDLRLLALEHQHRRRKSVIRGFVGGRVDLIPHQLSIAAEVAERLNPRVLLADEVGLGKTIEACLILHRLLQTGRIRRVLILVPEPLVHQWFVELLRRFNLWFHIFDEERCAAIQGGQAEVNPFLDDQLVLCGIGFLAHSPERGRQAQAAGWDMVVIDEAHHLGWTNQETSPEYALAQSLGAQTPGMLLLTATPEQLGIEAHFARLRLLDPDRYYDLDAFLHEATQYRLVAEIAGKLLHRQLLNPAEVEVLARILRREEEEIRASLSKIDGGEEAVRQELIDDLVDQHGTGRVMFRNTRATVPGFPRRIPSIQPLDPDGGSANLFQELAEEFAADAKESINAEFKPQLKGDPRIKWLAALLRQLNQEKILLICRTQAKAEAIADALRELLTVKAALFHEGLPLIQRDRNAAWFAEEDGAQLLLASEIGSEGRNFQFAHHLVLFDLPLDPDLLEQRIGRLDRIGQKTDIHVHVPYVIGSSQEVLARWYGEGLNAFEKNLRGGHELLEAFGSRLFDLAQDYHETRESSAPALDLLISETRAAARELNIRLEQGRDRLLELNSFRPAVASRMIQTIREADANQALETFMLRVFDEFSIQAEEVAPRTYRLGSAGVFADAFPGLPTEGLTVTLDRQRALAREDLQFLTWDHPLATGALDLILGTGKGNSSIALWPDDRVPGLYVEGLFVVECVARPGLHLDRFFPPTPIHLVLDQRGTDVTTAVSAALLSQKLKPLARSRLLDSEEFREELLPSLLQKAEAIASTQIEPLLAQARRELDKQLQHEIARLRELQAVNPNVTAGEIELLVAHQNELHDALARPRLRLDAIRLIERGGMR